MYMNEPFPGALAANDLTRNPYGASISRVAFNRRKYVQPRRDACSDRSRS